MTRVLGGQYMATVLLEMYRKRVASIDKGGAGEVDSDLLVPDKALVATVLRPSTPRRVYRMVVGLHQYRQRTHAESGFG